MPVFARVCSDCIVGEFSLNSSDSDCIVVTVLSLIVLIALWRRQPCGDAIAYDCSDCIVEKAALWCPYLSGFVLIALLEKAALIVVTGIALWRRQPCGARICQGLF